MQLQFLGAAGTVTGSRFLVETDTTRLLVDCGLFQGVKGLRERNWLRFPVDPSSLDAVVLSHAHIDHSGYLPALVRDGFTGPVLCSTPTRDLCGIMLRDAAYLQEEDARYANRKGHSRHAPALPLYNQQDAEAAMRAFSAMERGEVRTVGDIEVDLVPAGHILGATSVRLRSGGRSLLISGDLGRAHDLLMLPPDANPGADVVVMESTYGDRRHSEGDPVAAIGEVVRRTVERGGVVLIAAFSVGRAQSMLWALHQLMASGDVPRVPVYLNSPMADRATHLYDDHVAWHRLSAAQCRELYASARFVRSVEESKSLNGLREPAVIVSASGMLTGGRIVHHLRSFAPRPENTILLPGFQAPGTRGGQLVAGAEELKIHGRYVPIRAEVAQLDGFSAHADRKELITWLDSAEQDPSQVWLVHGEPAASDALRVRIEDELGLETHVAVDQQKVKI